MSDTANPWQSPAAEAAAEEHMAQGVLTAAMIRYLKEASPWLRFIGILGYIGAAILFGVGIFMAIILLINGVRNRSGVVEFITSFMGFIYVIMGVLCFFPARFTHRFGAKIRNYLLSGAEKDLEEALKNNKSLWKFSGIMAIVYLALMPAGIVIAVVTAVSSAFGL
jgi:hypothetical protein